MLTSSDISFELESSTLVSDLYGLIRHIILYLFFVRPYRNFTILLVKHHVIKKGPPYGVSYFYAVWLTSMFLSPNLQS